MLSIVEDFVKILRKTATTSCLNYDEELNLIAQAMREVEDAGIEMQKKIVKDLAFCKYCRKYYKKDVFKIRKDEDEIVAECPCGHLVNWNEAIDKRDAENAVTVN